MPIGFEFACGDHSVVNSIQHSQICNTHTHTHKVLKPSLQVPNINQG